MMNYSNMNVLIVEDDLLIQRFIQKTIQGINSSTNIYVSSTVEEALKIAYEVVIDIFIFDIELADGGNGIVLAKKIRKITRYFDSPIIFSTSFTDKELPMYRAVRCQTFITKPVEQEKIEKAYHIAVKSIISRDIDKEPEHRKKRTFLPLTYRGITDNFILEDIVFFKSKRTHVQVVYYDSVKHTLIVIEKIESLKNITRMLMELNDGNFVRCHKCFLINQQHVVQTDWRNQRLKLRFNNNHALNQITWFGETDQPLYIPIGDKYKDNFMKEDA